MLRKERGLAAGGGAGATGGEACFPVGVQTQRGAVGMSVKAVPDGAFGWGFPSLSRPAVRVLDRTRHHDGDDRALIEVEIGRDLFWRCRFVVQVGKEVPESELRALAFKKFVGYAADLHGHLELLETDAEGLEANEVWGDEFMFLEPVNERGQDRP